MTRIRIVREESRLEKIAKMGEFPIYVWEFQTTTPEYIRIAIEELNGLLGSLGLSEFFPVYYMGESWSQGPPWPCPPFGCSEWYFLQAERRRNPYGDPQYRIDDVIKLCKEEPWQEKPHIELLVTEVDLYARGTNFVFGATDPLIILGREPTINPYPFLGLSYYRMEKWYDNPKEIFTLLLYHELGHLFGAPSREREDTQKILGHHCPRIDCAMSQVNVEREIWYPDRRREKRFVDAEEAWRYVSRREERTGIPYCERCWNDLNEAGRILVKDLFRC